MSTKAAGKRVRLSPEHRAAEIVRAAARVARADGLGALSMRSVAETAAVTPGLVAAALTPAEGDRP